MFDYQYFLHCSTLSIFTIIIRTTSNRQFYDSFGFTVDLLRYAQGVDNESQDSTSDYFTGYTSTCDCVDTSELVHRSRYVRCYVRRDQGFTQRLALWKRATIDVSDASLHIHDQGPFARDTSDDSIDLRISSDCLFLKLSLLGSGRHVCFRRIVKTATWICRC